MALDTASGKALALRWCAACHLVAQDQPRINDSLLPRFYEMAIAPGFSEGMLKTFLADPHPKMPNMTLNNNGLADLVRYIGSLAP